MNDEHVPRLEPALTNEHAEVANRVERREQTSHSDSAHELLLQRKRLAALTHAANAGGISRLGDGVHRQEVKGLSAHTVSSARAAAVADDVFNQRQLRPIDSFVGNGPATSLSRKQLAPNARL